MQLASSCNQLLIRFKVGLQCKFEIPDRSPVNGADAGAPTPVPAPDPAPASAVLRSCSGPIGVQ